jgi:hypothetical protein
VVGVEELGDFMNAQLDVVPVCMSGGVSAASAGKLSASESGSVGEDVRISSEYLVEPEWEKACSILSVVGTTGRGV